MTHPVTTNRVRTHNSETVDPTSTQAGKEREATAAGSSPATLRDAWNRQDSSPGGQAGITRHQDSVLRGLGSSTTGTTGEQRTDTARSAVANMAKELNIGQPEVDAFAARFATARYAGSNPSQIASQAKSSFGAAVLQAHPDRADQLVGMRTRNLGGDAHQVVDLALASSGSQGARKVAGCEDVLRAIGHMPQAEVSEVLRLMKTGTSLQAAIAQQKAATATATAARTLDNATFLNSAARDSLIAAHNRKAEGKAMLDRVNAEYRGVPILSRGAEFIAGTVAATATVQAGLASGPEAVWSRSLEQPRRVLNDADAAAGFMAGELTDRIGKAKGLYDRFIAQQSEYDKAVGELHDASAAQDYEGIARSTRRVDEIASSMVKIADDVCSKSRDIRVRSEEFNRTMVHAAVHTAVTAVTLGIGGMPAEHALSRAISTRLAGSVSEPAAATIGEAVGEAYGAGAEGLITRAATAGGHAAEAPRDSDTAGSGHE